MSEQIVVSARDCNRLADFWETEKNTHGFLAGPSTIVLIEQTIRALRKLEAILKATE